MKLLTSNKAKHFDVEGKNAQAKVKVICKKRLAKFTTINYARAFLGVTSLKNLSGFLALAAPSI